MTRVLFVTNGHGEAAIAERIARELRSLGAFTTDHFALVGAALGGDGFTDVGPQRTMPSGGLVAMGNVRAFAADVRAGFFALLASQLGFLRGAHRRYASVIAVGDVYALLLALVVRRPLVFVGTAKSVHVAPYGLFERRLLRRSRRVFVRDVATAAYLRARGVRAEAPGNVIVDLLETSGRVEWGTADHRIALLPGSRQSAYPDAVRLGHVARRVMRLVPATAAVMSVAPGLDRSRFEPALSAQPPLAAWSGELGALLGEATLALGQAGTANEAAAACGIPVVALADNGAAEPAWYRMRQARLLGDALVVIPDDVDLAAAAVAGLLSDAPRRAAMARAGRERMGTGGGALAIARAIAESSARAR